MTRDRPGVARDWRAGGAHERASSRPAEGADADADIDATGGSVAGPSRRGFLSVGAAGLAALAGCPSGAGPVPGETATPTTAGPVEVLHDWTGEANSAAMDAVAARFEDEHARVDLEVNALSREVGEIVRRRLEHDDPPSSFATRPGAHLERFAGDLAPVDDAWTETGLADATVDAVVEACRHEGTFRAVPVDAYRVNTLAYNVAVLETAGVDPASLSSVDALLDALAAVEEATDAAPLAHSLAGAWPTLLLWETVLLATAGPDGYRAFLDGEADRETVRDALALTRDLAGYAPEDAGDAYFTVLVDRVADGTAAAVPMGSWAFAAFAEAESVAYGDDWDWVPFPGTADSFAAALEGFAVPACAPSPDGVGTWTAFLADRGTQVAFNQTPRGSVPPRTDVDAAALPAYAERLSADLADAAAHPLSLTRHLGVPPAVREACLAAVDEHFSDPFDVEATTDALLAAVSET